MYEIAHGEASINQEFYEMDDDVLRLSLDILVKKNQAQIFKTADGSESGIKFI